MEFPETVITKGKNGRPEIRALDHRGSYVICKYLDPKTMKAADSKRKLMLKDEEGTVREYFIIPLKDPKRSLLIFPETKEKDREVWNERKATSEGIWAGGTYDGVTATV